MIKFLKRLVAKAQPIYVDQYTIEWKLFWRLRLVCQYKSEDRDDYRPIEHSLLLVLVAGSVTHYQPPHLPRMFSAPHVWWLRKGLQYHSELLPATTFEDSILDMPGWMDVTDVKRNTDKQAWFLQVVF